MRMVISLLVAKFSGSRPHQNSISCDNTSLNKVPIHLSLLRWFDTQKSLVHGFNYVLDTFLL